MFQKVLVANRGEIAVRVLRTLKEMGIASVAIYSEADQDSLHVQLADEALCVGSGPAQDSYLNRENILSAAILTGAQAIYPGFGFLAEDAQFAEMCAACQITFIGPSAENIALMGDKARARQFMQQAKVPVIPGSDGFLENLAQAEKVAAEIGYPILLKAAAGGGGRGIRRLENDHDLRTHFAATQQEAQVAFGDGRMYLEKIIAPAKHIELQVIRDQQGQTVVFPERDCSAQRHHQKLLEESPCVLISPEQRAHLMTLVKQAAEALHYVNTGTIEFLMDQNQQFYFMEMNTRIQVEHPITEMVAQVDLIKAQLTVAMGQPLPWRQQDIKIHGHALECRLNAEDPTQDFLPVAGKIDYLYWPVGGIGVRIDSGIYAGSVVPPFYDAMLAKLITFAPERKAAIAKMQRLLQETIIRGVPTNREFEAVLLQDPTFLKGELTTMSVNQTVLPDWLATKEAETRAPV